jgi:hypothetical protein
VFFVLNRLTDRLLSDRLLFLTLYVLANFAVVDLITSLFELVALNLRLNQVLTCVWDSEGCIITSIGRRLSRVRLI